MKKAAKKVFWAIVALVMAAGISASPEASAETLTIKGSDTIVILSQRWAETYMQLFPSATIQVTGGGSGTGIAALINGTTRLANASRPIKKKEVERAKKAGRTIKEFRVAMDGLAVIVSAKNPVSELSLKQLMGIYIGRFNNWKQVGGPDKKILRYCRESNSGTYVFFKDNVLKKRDYAADCQTLPGTAAVAEATARDQWGIGYGGIAYFAKRPELKILSVSVKKGEPAISPLTPTGEIDIKGIKSGKYPIARFLNVYSLGEPKGLAKKFMEWVMGPQGQAIVAKVGYVPVAATSPANN